MVNFLLNLFSPYIGWESKSFGYHGDDGNKFESTGTGAPYGPLFTTGDTIGCAINFFSKKAFYTKNGKNLGSHSIHEINIFF